MIIIYSFVRCGSVNLFLFLKGSNIFIIEHLVEINGCRTENIII